MDLEERMQGYLAQQREALLAKCEGLSERELRLPRTPAFDQPARDPQADWYATADETIASLDIDAPGTVAWWGDRPVTLGCRF